MIMEDLSEADCLELLAGHHFGRIGVVSDGQPMIFPVNYFFEDRRVAIRTDPGTKLSAAAQGQVAFEIDGDRRGRPSRLECGGHRRRLRGNGRPGRWQRSATPFPGRHLGAWSEVSLDPDRAADRNGPETSTRLTGICSARLIKAGHRHR